METIVKASNYSDQNACMLAIEAADILIRFFKKEGWKPTTEECDTFYKAVCSYIINFKKATQEKNGNWYVLVSHRSLNAKRKRTNSVGKAMSYSEKKLLKDLKKLNILDLDLPEYSLLITCYLSFNNQAALYSKIKRRNQIKFSERYGDTYRVLFEEEFPA